MTATASGERPAWLPGLPTEWRWLRLPELLQLVVDNRGRTAPVAAKGTPLIATNCIVESGLYPVFAKVRYVSTETMATWFRSHPEPGDVLFVNKGTPGQTCLVPDPVGFCIAQDMVALRVSKHLATGEFLLAALRSPLLRDQVRNLSVGTSIPHLKKGDFDQIWLPLPPPHEAARLGRAYCAIGEKLELNRLMGRTLEEMAQAIFKSWFIDFDGHSDLVDSELGPIPAGWHPGTLGDLVTLVTERVKATPEKDSERYVALDDMPSKSIDLSNFRLGSEVNSSITRFKKGDILFGSMRPYFHKVGLAQFDGITRTTTFVLRPLEPVWRYVALMWAASEMAVEFATSSSIGTTIPYVRWDALSRFRLVIPPVGTAERFAEVVSPIVERMAVAGEESRTLAQVRDSLLPKLISGELRVPDAEELIEEAAS